MGMKSALFFITFYFTSFFCIAQSENIEFDSLINYQVKKKETLYSISKKFITDIDDILIYNPKLKSNKLRKNTTIVIPLKKKRVSKLNINDENKIDTIVNLNRFKIKKDLIKLAYLAPFKMKTLKLDSLNIMKDFLKEVNLTTISINFYNGIIAAIDELEKSNVKVSVDVFDTENEINKVLSIKKANDFYNYDLIIGPLIKRNYNAFHEDKLNTNSISPLVYDEINLNSSTIVPEANAALKREKMLTIIDSLILENQDQCALIISDSINFKSRDLLLKRFPLAEIINLNKIKNSVDPKIADSLLGNYKENWVFLETKKPNLISSVTSMLNAQISKKRKIRLFSTVSNQNYENPNVNYEKLGNLSFMYPSNSTPNYSSKFTDLQNNFLNKFGKYPEKISLTAFDIIKDILFRISVSKSFKKSIDMGETRSIQNKFNYIYNDKTGFENTSFFILRHNDLDINEHQN